MKPIPAPCTCPACDRFIDLNPECPYCGVDSPRRPLQHTLQLSAMTFSLAGLVLLLLIARASCPASVSIAQLRPVMNHGWVTLSGTLLRSPGIKTPESVFKQAARAPNWISFDLADSSGQISVIATRSPAPPLVERLGLPTKHSPVHVSGHLYLVAGKPPRLYLDAVQPPDLERSTKVRPL